MRAGRGWPAWLGLGLGLLLAACHKDPPPAAKEVPPAAKETPPELARLAPFSGAWHCVMKHEAGADAPARTVRQRLAITLHATEARYDVAWSPEPGDAAGDPVTSDMSWRYDAPASAFVYEGTVGSGSTEGSERYTSAGPDADRLVWTGAFSGAISVPMRMTYVRGAAGAITFFDEAEVDGAWKRLSSATCRP